MPKWAEHVRPRLSSLRLSPAREHEIVDELSQHLEDRWRELKAGGASDEDATRLALAGFREGNLLARYMAPLHQSAHQRTKRRRQRRRSSRRFGRGALAVIGETTSRYRRPVSPRLAIERLMLLDVVLATSRQGDARTHASTGPGIPGRGCEGVRRTTVHGDVPPMAETRKRRVRRPILARDRRGAGHWRRPRRVIRPAAYLSTSLTPG
ncbi:MAG TPA: permease prefix domain 1-containing protein [Vicinamibacterales bacterium]|nr:permease prefix domain 1-containing protein [Vicinamibacterales bacterium]